MRYRKRRFNPAEAEDGFRRLFDKVQRVRNLSVSIQPKPKTGLEVVRTVANALRVIVSIQPKPKTGLEVGRQRRGDARMPVSIQPKPKTGLEVNANCVAVN